MLRYLPAAVSQWWAAYMPAGTSPHATSISNAFLYHTIELARNAMDYSDNALILARVHRRKWTIFLSDDGPGMDPQFALYNSLNGGFGFRNAFLFADTFVVETFSRRYEKRRTELLYTGEGTVTQGTTIVLGKLFPTT